MPDPRIPTAVRHLTTGEGLPTLRDDRLPLDAVQRLWSELAGTPDADALSLAVAGLMGTASIDLDHQILRFFENHPGAPGGEVLADALRMRADAFPVGGACPIPGERRDARQVLLRACLRWGPVPADLLPVFRAEALTPGRAGAILMGLRRRDAAWVDTNLNAILFASPDAGPATWSELLDEGWSHARALDWILARVETVDLPTWRILLGYYVSDPALRAELDAKLVARA